MKNFSEQNLQKSLVTWFRAQYPKIKIIASTSGQQRTIWEQRQAKELGMEKGVPDLFICKPSFGYGGLFLEIKNGKVGRVSPEQRDYMLRLNIDGYKTEVVRSLDEGMEIITNYMNGI